MREDGGKEGVRDREMEREKEIKGKEERREVERKEGKIHSRAEGREVQCSS